MSQAIETSFNTTTGANNGFNQAPGLKIRLDTSDIIERVEMYLKGEVKVVYKDEEGNLFERREQSSDAKANKKGVHAILNFMSLIINSAVVQGNFPIDGEGKSQMYDTYIEEINTSLLSMIMTNIYKWDISEYEIEEIIDAIMAIVIPYMTRTLGNKERESYENTVRHMETNTVRENGKQGFSLLGQ
jgi:hypothetical protein